MRSVQLLLESLNNAQLNTELLTELSDRLFSVENILRNFILGLNTPTLPSEHGNEVHQFLCLDLTRTLTNLKQCSDNYFMNGVDENSPNIVIESQAGQIIERLSIWVPMIYETIENETL